jgi:hypothetical protein
MRGLNVCVLGPAALIVTAVVIALTPLVGNTAEPSATMRAAGDETCQVADAEITWGVTESLRSYISGTIASGEWAVATVPAMRPR